MADEQTLRFYAEMAKTYAAQANAQPGEHLRDFVAALTPGARVLELGSGGGHDAAYMLSQGISLDATDASPQLAAEAEIRIGQPVAIMRFDQLEAVSLYDGVWANASLLHAPDSELSDDLRRIHRALSHGGLFLSSFKAGTGEGRDGFGRYYNYPDRATLETRFRTAADWHDLAITERAGSGFDKRPTTWLWVAARKRGP